MYIDIVPNLASPPAVLLRQSRRESGKIVKTTLANLSQCPPEAVAALRLALRGVALVPHEEVFAVERSLPHGHVQAVLGVMRAAAIGPVFEVGHHAGVAHDNVGAGTGGRRRGRE